MTSATRNAASSSVQLSANMSASAIERHLEAGATTRDTVVEFLTTSVYPLSEVAKLAGLLGDDLTSVLEAQQGMAIVATVAHKPSGRKPMECPISREAFVEHATALELTINGVPMTAAPKEFSTGSFGYNLSGKMPVKVGSHTVQLQLSVNLTVIGSKQLAQ